VHEAEETDYLRRLVSSADTMDKRAQ